MHRALLHQLHDLLERGHGHLDGARDHVAFLWVFAHVEVVLAWVEQVTNALVVDLDVRERELPVEVVLLLGELEDVGDRARHHAGIALGARHRVRLAAAGGAVREARAVETGYHRLDHAFHALVVHLLARALRPEGMVECVRFVLGHVEPQVVEAAHLVVGIVGVHCLTVLNLDAVVRALGKLLARHRPAAHTNHHARLTPVAGVDHRRDLACMGGRATVARPWLALLRRPCLGLLGDERRLLVPLLDLLGRLLLDEVVVREAALRRGARLLLEVAHHLGVHAAGVAHVTVTVAACLRAEQEVRLVEEATGLRHGGESGFRIGKRKPVHRYGSVIRSNFKVPVQVNQDPTVSVYRGCLG